MAVAVKSWSRDEGARLAPRRRRGKKGQRARARSLKPQACCVSFCDVTNGPAKAEFWKRFVAENCRFPALARLRGQLAKAEFTDFCQCGCNSFGLRIPPGTDLQPLVTPRPEVRPDRHAAIYTADFQFADDKTLEIIIFADDEGNLAGIDVDCCANSFPVPQTVSITDAPIHTWASSNLLLP